MIDFDWCVAKRAELLSKYDYKGLSKLFDELFESAYGGESEESDEPAECKDYVASVTLSVISDIFHSDYYEQFRADYPGITFGRELPFYIRKAPSAKPDQRKKAREKPSEPNHGSEQIKLF